MLAFHPPCTLQHGQQLRGGVEQHLGELGFTVRVALNESHLCCGSAGTYSVLQPEIAHQLRDRKLGHLAELQPQAIISANIGCITHLQSGTATPVRHWVEVLDAALQPPDNPCQRRRAQYVPAMRRADRLFHIIQLIRGRRLTTAAYLAERLEVSERTIYRDVADLQLPGRAHRGRSRRGLPARRRASTCRR